MDVFIAISDPTRRSILDMLARKGELSATEISDQFKMSAPAISQHLKVLRDSDLVQVDKRGRQRIYRINPQTLKELDSWTKTLTDQWNKRLDTLEAILKADEGPKLLVEKKGR